MSSPDLRPLQLFAILHTQMASNSMIGKQIDASHILGSMPGPWGAAIARLRHAKKLTRDAAAHKAGLTPTTYGRIESGRHTRTRKLQQIAEAFNVPLEEVLMVPMGERRSGVFEQLIDQRIDQRVEAGVREKLAELRRSAPPVGPPPATPKELAAMTDLVKEQEAHAAEQEALARKAEQTRKKLGKRKRK